MLVIVVDSMIRAMLAVLILGIAVYQYFQHRMNAYDSGVYLFVFSMALSWLVDDVVFKVEYFRDALNEWIDAQDIQE